jgi:hypothetical protein
MTTIRLGYAVGSGDPVDVPRKHLAICGQTQDGQDDALQGLIHRSGLAVAFVTKRGEQFPRRGRRYFMNKPTGIRASILEPRAGAPKVQRDYRASRGAPHYDVQANVQTP